MRVHHVDGAGQTRVEGVNRAEQFERTFRVRHRCFDERGFVRAALALGVSRTGIPGGRYDRLVIVDGLVSISTQCPSDPRGASKKPNPRAVWGQEFGSHFSPL